MEVTCMEKIAFTWESTYSSTKYMHWTLTWLASLQCVLQLEWRWVFACPGGKLEKCSGMARLNSGLVQLDVLLAAEGDPEDYMFIPDADVDGCSWWQGVPQWGFHQKSPLLGFSSSCAVGFSSPASRSPVLLMMSDCVSFDQWIIYSVKPLKDQNSIQ